MMNKKGLCSLVVCMLAVCIVVSVLAQPAPIANVTTANEETIVFDTGPSYCPYPSISGTHNGTITPYVTIYNVSKLYTYPCEGTGGHTESVVFYYPNGTKITVGRWEGYSGDGHNITFPAFTIIANHTYYYSIRTGSYPQIHHTDELEAKDGMGTINCTSFVDANGRSYDNWIPAIRLVGSTSDSNVTLIGDIKANPEAYEGKIVTITGKNLGWHPKEGCGPCPPGTRSDWCIEDETGCIWVTGSCWWNYGQFPKIEGMVKICNRLNITFPYIDMRWTVEGVELSCPDPDKTVKVNETANYTITVTNTECVRDTFNLVVTNMDKASIADLSTDSITIDAGANGYVTLEVADETAGRYNVAVTATPQRKKNNTDTIGTHTTISNITLIGDIKANPEAYEGKIVTVAGKNLGWNCFECGPGPPVTRSDGCIEDGTGCIYVARGRPFGEHLKIEGMVKMYTKLNITCPYIDPVWTLDGVELSCHDPDKTVKVNETANYTIIVTNTESVRDTFNLTITNMDNASVAELSTDSITIDAGSNGYVTLEVADESTERYKVYKVAVTATPQRNKNNTDTIGTYTTIWTPSDGVELSYHDREKTVTTNETANYTIVVTNTESVRDTFNLTVMNVNNASVANLSTDSITIDAGANGYVTLEVADETAGIYNVYVSAIPQRHKEDADGIMTYTIVIMEVQDYERDIQA